MGQGVYRKRKLWAAVGRMELEALALDPWRVVVGGGSCWKYWTDWIL
jgi:hypothetical protein